MDEGRLDAGSTLDDDAVVLYSLNTEARTPT
jgi:hypothetical protein